MNKPDKIVITSDVVKYDKSFFEPVEKLNLSIDSDLELVRVGGKKYIIKNYSGNHGSEAIADRTKELLFHSRLRELGLPCLNFKYLDKVNSNQLCMEYIEQMKIWNAAQDPQKNIELAKYIKN